MGSSTSRVRSFTPCTLDDIGVASRIKSQKSYSLGQNTKRVKRSNTMRYDDCTKSYHAVFMEKLERRRHQKSFEITVNKSEAGQLNAFCN